MDDRNSRAHGKSQLRGSFAWQCLFPAAGMLLTLGCVAQRDLPATKETNPPVAAVDRNHPQPMRMPHSSTCVAFADFRVKAALDPKRSPGEKEQMRDEARRAYQQALKIEPSCLAAYSGLARLYQAMGDRERAIQTYQKGLQALPQAASLRFDLGLCQARQKDWQPALQNLQAAVNLDPENTAYVKTLAFCLGQVGRYNESLVMFRKVVGEPEAHYNVARMLHYVHEDTLSKHHLTLALEANPNLAGANELMADLNNVSADGGQGAVATVSFEKLEEASLQFNDGAP
jgi:tetratricopeptide (TPR) repeat protein